MKVYSIVHLLMPYSDLDISIWDTIKIDKGLYCSITCSDLQLTVFSFWIMVHMVYTTGNKRSIA